MLLSELTKITIKALYLQTDSVHRTGLHSLWTEPKIKQNSNTDSWKYICRVDNPAHLSMELLPHQIRDNNLHWKGPVCLRSSHTDHDEQPEVLDYEQVPEYHTQITAYATVVEGINFNYFSTFTKVNTCHCVLLVIFIQLSMAWSSVHWACLITRLWENRDKDTLNNITWSVWKKDSWYKIEETIKFK